MKKQLSGGLLSVALLFGLGACAGTNSNGGFDTVDGPSPTVNNTPGQEALMCAKDHINLNADEIVQISVGNVKDYTGKISVSDNGGGYKVTQGGTLMVYSTLGEFQPVLDLVERHSTQLFKQELEFTKNKLVTDNGKTTRAVKAGQVQGLDYYVVGGITEVNYNIQSGGVQAGIAGWNAGTRIFAMSVAVDLRLIDAQSLNVVDTTTIRKQVIGYETEAGVFDFFGGTLVDVNAGNKAQEPLQLGVRSTLQLATMKLLYTLYGLQDDGCIEQFEESFKPVLAKDQEKEGNRFLNSNQN